MEKEHYLHSDKHIENNISNGWEFKFGDYISLGFEYMNKQIGYNILFIVIIMAIGFATGLIPFAGALISAIFLNVCLNMGFATATNHFNRTPETDFNTYFDGFKFIGPISVYGLIVLVVSLLFGVLIFGFIGFSYFTDFLEIQQNPMDQELARDFVLGLVSKIPFILVAGLIVGFFTYPLTFAPFFIVFHGKDAVESIRLSYKLVMKNWLIGYVFIIVSGIIGVAGVIACGVGLLYTIPALRNMLYAMFEDMTGMNQEDGSVSFTDANTIDG